MIRCYANLADLEADLTARAARVAVVRERVDPRGMTRPKRDPVERAFLLAHGLPLYAEECDVAAPDGVERESSTR